MAYPKEPVNGSILRSGSVPGQLESESKSRGDMPGGAKNGASASVADLCVSLQHRWEPAVRFMIITVYFDESGTHDSPFSLMAGREYEKRTKRLFALNDVENFHAIDVRRGKGSFKNWSVDRKIEFLDDYQDIINKTTEMAVFSVIYENDYQWYRSIEREDKSVVIESKYAILFRGAMSILYWEGPKVQRWKGLHNPPLYVVIEKGHPNCGDVLRFYNEANAVFPGSDGLKGITFQTKQGNLPLAASDLLAYSTYKDISKAKDIGLLKRRSKAEKSFRGTTYGKKLDRQDLLTLSQWKPVKT